MPADGRDLSILVIGENVDRAAVLEQGLAEAGYARVMVIHSATDLLQHIQALDPEVVVIGLASPDRDTLDGIFLVARAVHRPIAMFVDRSDAASITAAVDAGVSAYVVDGLRKERVKAIVDMAVSRFHAFERLRRERDAARTALGERKIIDRAKGLLMERKGMTEQAAYAAMRQAAMRRNRRLADVAQSVITACELEM